MFALSRRSSRRLSIAAAGAAAALSVLSAPGAALADDGAQFTANFPISCSYGPSLPGGRPILGQATTHVSITPSTLLPGSSVQVTGGTSLSFDGAAATGFTIAGGRSRSTSGSLSMRSSILTVTGTTKSSTGSLSGGAGSPTAGVPFTLAPVGDSTVDAGTVTTLPGSPVTFTAAPIELTAYFAYSDPLDGLPYIDNVYSMVCTPTADATVASLNVAAVGPLKPAVQSLSPAHGPAGGGNQVVIGGVHGAPVSSVSFGGVDAPIVSSTDTTTTVVAPAGTAGSTVDVVETNSAGSSDVVSADQYTYDAAAPVQVSYPYSLAGSATLKNLVKGTLPLSGSIAANLSVATGAFTASLSLNQTTANLTALGFLPVTAKVAITPTDQVVGQLKAGVLTATAKVRIKLPSITTFGLQLAGGASCQTTQVSTIPLKSTQPQFLPLNGGPIAGTFAISNLSGCGALTGLVSPLTAGTGNAILLNLTPPAQS